MAWNSGHEKNSSMGSSILQSVVNKIQKLSLECLHGWITCVSRAALSNWTIGDDPVTGKQE